MRCRELGDRRERKGQPDELPTANRRRERSAGGFSPALQLEDGEASVRAANLCRDADRIAANGHGEDELPALRRQVHAAQGRALERDRPAECLGGSGRVVTAPAHQLECLRKKPEHGQLGRAIEGRGVSVTADDAERTVTVARREVGGPTGKKAARGVGPDAVIERDGIGCGVALVLGERGTVGERENRHPDRDRQACNGHGCHAGAADEGQERQAERHARRRRRPFAQPQERRKGAGDQERAGERDEHGQEHQRNSDLALARERFRIGLAEEECGGDRCQDRNCRNIHGRDPAAPDLERCRSCR